jgi:Na+-transporting NADH:ubiquinone oxidoreductase subunit A
MSKVIKLKRGLDIPLKGKAEKVIIKPDLARNFAVKPVDFHGIRPKMMVHADDTVKAGTPLFFDKYNPDVFFTSPVSGKVVAINRGERRKILEVVIKRDDTMKYEEFQKSDPLKLSREEIAGRLLKAGLWPLLVQRPYGIIPRPGDVPRSIFISGFDTAPMAPDLDFVMQGTTIHLNVNADIPVADVYANASGVRFELFLRTSSCRKSGCADTSHIDPLHKNGTVWHIAPQDVLALSGALFLNGVVDFTSIVALTGSEVIKSKILHNTMLGDSVNNLLKDNVKKRERENY